jgi:hypothetical protein
MTHLCCTHCRLRFTPAASACLVACPECGARPRPVSLESMVGFRKFRFENAGDSLPEAVSVSLPIPEPGGAQP